MSAEEEGRAEASEAEPASAGPEPGASEDGGAAEDARLVERVLAGATEHYALLVRRHQDSLYRQARSLDLEEDTAADMVQDALVKAYERLSTCRDPARFRVWVGRILRNRCLDHLKSAPRQRDLPLSPELPDGEETPDRDFERGAVGEALRSALATLPPDQREAFLLKHAEGRSYEEIAEITGTSVSALKMRVHRARDRLQEALAAEGVDPPGTASL